MYGCTRKRDKSPIRRSQVRTSTSCMTHALRNLCSTHAPKMSRQSCDPFLRIEHTVQVKLKDETSAHGVACGVTKTVCTICLLCTVSHKPSNCACFARFLENEYLCSFLLVMRIVQCMGPFWIVHFAHFCSFLHNLELRHDRKTRIM